MSKEYGTPEELIEGVFFIADGGVYVSSQIALRLVDANRLSLLSPREREVFQLIRIEKTSVEMATISNH